MIATLSLVIASGLPLAVRAAPETFLPQDYLRGAWWLYKSVFVEEGRVVDPSNGSVSHSEGQGYGMLIAVAADDRAGFDALWSWTKKTLYVRGDALAAWKWDPNAAGHVTDPNNASDGDLLIAWALFRAAATWNAPELKAEARAILRDLAAKAVIEVKGYGPVLLPAAHGFSAGEQAGAPVVNLSYWVFPALKDLAGFDDTFPAEALFASGQALLSKGRFGSSDLPADWMSLEGDVPRPAPTYAPVFGYEAIRIPLYAAWALAEPPRLLDGLDKRWRQHGAPALTVMDLATAAPLTAMSDPGYRAVSTLLSCSLSSGGTGDEIAPFAPTEYYPSTLHLLSLLAISERYASCLPSLN
ncbi:hypothetical protein BJF93_20720 [Xaviernesmea oryzae]|uniref:cellulase n=2 Tax=Xaviernesmea oryzae TaxID=464029 RepID=A0A1Q9AZQ5_9HYPH|nr:hypothetical protein BJF93_20720 [Xaviernesmea oryzae]SEL50695.1 endoglucanase [Xaviernesmea oryzae]